jgi:hypothetical protein
MSNPRSVKKSPIEWISFNKNHESSQSRFSEPQGTDVINNQSELRYNTSENLYFNSNPPINGSIGTIHSRLDDSKKCMDLKFPSLTIIAGMSESGKTNLMKHLIRLHASKFHRIVVLCPTLDLQSSYECIDPNCLIREPSSGDIEKIMEQQSKFPNLRTMLILDDCLGSVRFRDNVFDRLASSGRHYNISTFIIIQDLKKITPTIRDNAKVMYVTKLKSHSLEACFDISNGFTNKSEFLTYINSNCRNHQIIRFNLSGDCEIPYMTFNPGICPKFRLSVGSIGSVGNNVTEGNK